MRDIANECATKAQSAGMWLYRRSARWLLSGHATGNESFALDREFNRAGSPAANIRAGYMYVISNIGSFGERMVKIGMTRRLLDRIRELRTHAM